MVDGRGLVLTAAVALLAVVGSATVAGASFTDAGSASATVTADVLAPATHPSAAPGSCSAFSGDRTVLSWTATASSWATGYEVGRSITAGGPYTVVATVSGVATTTYTDSPPAFSTTYYYAISAMRNTWRSTNATTSRTTKSSLCL